ncbi:MAG: LuxR family transcriptional regulator, partial [Chloroflexota bacterium]
MGLQILTTKLHIPSPTSTLVQRLRLTERLDTAVRYPLTVVSASAGSGKTTLLGGWLAEVQHPVAWLSLDARDSEPRRFMAHFIAALQRLDSDIGQTVTDTLRVSQQVIPEAIMTVLLNDLMILKEDSLLILDFQPGDSHPI